MAQANHGEYQNKGIGLYLKVFGTLIVLTIITVAVAQVDLGKINTLIAMLVATIKALVVMTWFMHMNHESTLNRIVFGSAFLFAFIFWLLTYMDVGTRTSLENLFINN